MSTNLKRDICNLKDPGASASQATKNTTLKAISYVCSFWVDHLANYLGDDAIDIQLYRKYLSDRGLVHQFLIRHILHWFEALSLIREIDRGIVGLHSLKRIVSREKSLLEVTSNHKALIHDAIQIFRQFRPAIEEAPLQIYNSVLIFSPENSITYQLQATIQCASGTRRQALSSRRSRAIRTGSGR